MLGLDKRRSALGAAIAVSLLAGMPAAAGPFSSVIVFGDSLIDSGNVQALSAEVGEEDPTPAALGYFEGRFTNGPTYADLLSERLTGSGLSLTFPYPFPGAPPPEEQGRPASRTRQTAAGKSEPVDEGSLCRDPKGDHAFPAPLSEDPHHTRAEVHVVDVEGGQLADADPCGVEELEHRPVAHVQRVNVVCRGRGHVEETAGVPLSEDGWQPRLPLRRRQAK